MVIARPLIGDPDETSAEALCAVRLRYDPGRSYFGSRNRHRDTSDRPFRPAVRALLVELLGPVAADHATRGHPRLAAHPARGDLPDRAQQLERKRLTGRCARSSVEMLARSTRAAATDRP